MTETDLLTLLKTAGIAYDYHAHEAAFTCEDVSRLGLEIDGADTKNLFLTDRADRFFLLATTHDKRVDLKEFAKRHNLPKLSFGAAEDMVRYLGVEPGSVTILGVVNDTGNKVELLIDHEIWAATRIQCHPLVNTATVRYCAGRSGAVFIRCAARAENCRRASAGVTPPKLPVDPK